MKKKNRGIQFLYGPPVIPDRDKDIEEQLKNYEHEKQFDTTDVDNNAKENKSEEEKSDDSKNNNFNVKNNVGVKIYGPPRRKK